MAEQCTARAKSTGQRCTRPPVVGATICFQHGGAAPQVREAGQRRVALRRAEEQALRATTALGVLVETSPEQALLDEVHRCAGMVAYYGARAAEVERGAHSPVDGQGGHEYPEDASGAPSPRQALVWGVTREKTGGEDYGTTSEARPSVWLDLWSKERDRLRMAAKTCIDCGIAERHVRIAEEQGSAVAGAMRRVAGELLEALITELQRLGVSDDVILAALRAVWDKTLAVVAPRELRALGGSEVTR